MYQQLLKQFIAISLLLASSLASAEGLATKNYPLPGHGSLQLQVSESWQEIVHQAPNGLPPTIVFTLKKGASFQMLLTPIYSMTKEMVLPKPDEMRMHLDFAAQAAKEQATEETIQIMELKGPSVIGYYFSVTDRAPEPGEYKFMSQGMMRVGDLAPSFTILSNEGAENAVTEALSMLKNAVHVK